MCIRDSRGIWRYTSVSDLIMFAKAVVLGSVLCLIAFLLLYRFQNFSRAVFIVDGLLLFFGLVGSRLAFRLLREILPLPHATEGRRVLIYGAGDGGEMVLRLSLIHISEPTRLLSISYAVFCL